MGCGGIGHGVFWLMMEHTLFNYLRETLLPLEDAWPGTIGSALHPQAGVLVGLTDEAEPRVVLGRRAAHLSLHPGEIAFPGGKREVEDASPWQTAAREAGEEVGLAPRISSALAGWSLCSPAPASRSIPASRSFLPTLTCGWTPENSTASF